MDRMNQFLNPNNNPAPIFSSKPLNVPKFPQGGSAGNLEQMKPADPFDELLSKEMRKGETDPSVDLENDYRSQLASLSLDELKREREKVIEDINAFVKSGDVESLKEAQRKYDIITKVIRERVFSEVHLAKGEEKPKQVAQVTQPSVDDIRKQLQKMDIVVPKDQPEPPTIAPQEERVYAEPSVYQEGSNNSNVRVMSLPGAIPTPQVSQATPPATGAPQGVTPNTYGANNLPLNTFSGLNNLNSLMGMNTMNGLMSSQLSLTQLMTQMASGNMGMGGFGLLGNNKGPLGDLYKELFVTGNLFPQNMNELGAIMALSDVKGLFDVKDDED